jgi:hypothetical protein
MNLPSSKALPGVLRQTLQKIRLRSHRINHGNLLAVGCADEQFVQVAASLTETMTWSPPNRGPPCCGVIGWFVRRELISRSEIPLPSGQGAQTLFGRPPRIARLSAGSVSSRSMIGQYLGQWNAYNFETPFRPECNLPPRPLTRRLTIWFWDAKTVKTGGIRAASLHPGGLLGWHNCCGEFTGLLRLILAVY